MAGQCQVNAVLPDDFIEVKLEHDLSTQWQLFEGVGRYQNMWFPVQFWGGFSLLSMNMPLRQGHCFKVNVHIRR